MPKLYNLISNGFIQVWGDETVLTYGPQRWCLECHEWIWRYWISPVYWFK